MKWLLLLIITLKNYWGKIMFKRVDNAVPEVIEGFSYMNKDGDIECVDFSYYTSESMSVDLTTLNNSGDPLSSIYISDIPNLIKALQAAYDFKMKE